MIEKFSADYLIPCYDTDLCQRLKPSAFLNMAQEAANHHAEYLGVGYDTLMELQQAWVMSRMKVQFERLPLWRDKVNLKSWHKGASGFMFLRDFILSDTEGNPLVKATTSWLVIDMTTRRLARRGAFAEFAADESKCIPEHVIEEPAAKVVIPEGFEVVKTATHTASYSDLDMNRHVNNVQYVVWAMDIVDLAVTEESQLRELEINFNTEVRPTDQVELTLYANPTEEGTLFVEGKVEGKNSFIIRLQF
jgi:acyl-ACP thioesterase